MNKTATAQSDKMAVFLPSNRGILQRKCTCGNHAVSGGECADCAKKKMGLQRKLTIGASNDPLEQEADRIADQVMATTDHGVVSGTPVKVQRFAGSSSGQIAEAPASVGRILASPGQPLETGLREEMEGRFGYDFSQVRVHTGSAAEQSARDVNAHAYTAGNNVVFGVGQFVPGTHEGKRLLAHELTHTLQQQSAVPSVIQRACPVLNEAEKAASKMSNNPQLETRLEFSAGVGNGNHKEVKAHPLTYRPPGGMRGTQPNPAVFQQIFNNLSEVNESQNWVRAHLLHGLTDRSGTRNLHGPGEENNLIITDKSLNGRMLNQVESCALNYVWDGVNVASGDSGNSLALWYEVKVDSIYPGYAFFAQSITVRYGLWDIATDGSGGSGRKGREFPTMVFENRTLPPPALAAIETSGAEAMNGSERMTIYELKASTVNATVAGPPRKTNDRQEKTLENVPINVRGLILKTMHIGSVRDVRGNRKDIIDAVLDVENVSLNEPLKQQLQADGNIIHLKREVRGSNVGRLSIDRRQNLALHPENLSEATIENLRIENGSVSGAGSLRPSLPLLSSRPMQLEFSPDRLRVFYGAAQRDVAQRGSSIRITQCTLGVDLLPEFRPSGELAFAMGPRGRDLLTGQVIASANQNGLIFDGTLNAHIPGTDEATGEAHYQDGQWNGLVRVESSKIRLPGFQRGELQLNFSTNEQGTLSLVPSGRVDLLIANQPITLEALYENNQFLFIGNGRFDLPSLEPFEARVETNGTDVSFEGRTGVTIRDINGQVTIRYRNGRLSGDGTAAINRGRAQGTANLHLSERGRIYGDGRISYRFTDSLTAAMGIAMDENQRIRVSGDITLATIQLFERFPRGNSGRRRLFRTHFGIPIAGFTLGPLGDIGLVLAIDPELGVYYGIGPGEIRNARITTAFDPMADNPDFEFTAGAQIYIPFDAGFYLTIPASLTVGAVVASVSAGLSASADIGLRGNFDADASLAYRQQIWSIETLAGIYANPRLALRIDGFLRAEALRGAYEAEKRWNLRNWEWGSNLRFGIEFPFRYVSNQPFQPPSFESIRFIYPEDINFQTMIRDIVDQEG